MLHLLSCVGAWCNKTKSIRGKSSPEHLLDLLWSSSWCLVMFVVYSPDYCHNQRLYCNVSSATTVFILRQYSLLIFHNTGSVALNSQQVNAVQLPSVGDSRTCSRKSGKAGEVDTAVGMLVHQKSKGCNTSLLRLDFWFSVVQCVGNRADVNFPYTTRFGLWSKPWACFSFATPATYIPPYCLAVLMPLP